MTREYSTFKHPSAKLTKWTKINIGHLDEKPTQIRGKATHIPNFDILVQK